MTRRWLVASLIVVAAWLSSAKAQQATSDQPTYDVEILIYQHLSTDATEELWKLELQAHKGLDIPADDVSPFDASIPAVPRPSDAFPALPPERMQLGALQAALRRSRDYRPLAHFGWTQPAFPRLAAPSISINDFVPAASGLSGEIALSRGRYLHLTLDLTFTPPEAPTQRYVIRQSRRMRSNERHYIDHPKFGVIALVAPTRR